MSLGRYECCLCYRPAVQDPPLTPAEKLRVALAALEAAIERLAVSFDRVAALLTRTSRHLVQGALSTIRAAVLCYMAERGVEALYQTFPRLVALARTWTSRDGRVTPGQSVRNLRGV